MPRERVNDLMTPCSLQPNPGVKVPPVTLHGSRTHVESISVFTSQLLNYNSQSIKSGAENESGGGPGGSQTTAALPV